MNVRVPAVAAFAGAVIFAFGAQAATLVFDGDASTPGQAGGWTNLANVHGGRPGGAAQAPGVSQLPATNIGSDGAWSLNAFGFTANTISEALEFKSEATAGSPSDGNAAANAVIATPEPEAWSLMLLGFAGLGALLRRRRPAAARA